MANTTQSAYVHFRFDWCGENGQVMEETGTR